MAQRLPKAAILGSRIGPLQTRSLFDEPARSLPPEKCPDLPAQGSTGTRAAMFVSPPSAIEPRARGFLRLQPLWSAVVSILAFKPLAAQRSWKYSNVGRLESAEDGHHARGILFKF